jgi:hypothetical protein
MSGKPGTDLIQLITRTESLSGDAVVATLGASNPLAMSSPGRIADASDQPEPGRVKIAEEGAMKPIACLSACFLASVVLSASAQQPDSGCRFSIVHAPTVPRITGPDEVVSRAAVMKQSDSPVAILSADFTGSTLIADKESYWFDDAFSVDIVNVSDRPLHDVRAWIQVVRVLTDGRRGGGGRHGRSMAISTGAGRNGPSSG